MKEPLKSLKSVHKYTILLHKFSKQPTQSFPFSNTETVHQLLQLCLTISAVDEKPVKALGATPLKQTTINLLSLLHVLQFF